MQQLSHISAALHASDNACLLLSAELRIVDANSAFLRVSSRLRNELIGQSVFDAFPAETRSAAQHADRPHATRAEELISIQELFDHAPGFVCLLRGPDHVIETMNSACYQLLCHRSVIGKPAREVAPAFALHDLSTVLDKVYQTGEPFLGHACRVLMQRAADAPMEEAFVDFVYHPVFAQDGTVTAILTFGYEVTQQVRAQQALRASEERFQLALEAAGDGVWDWDIATDRFSLSGRGRAMLGYAEEDVGQHLRDWLAITHPDDQNRVVAETMSCVQGRVPFLACEYRVRCKDGRWKWILARGAVVSRNDEGWALRMVGTTVDVSSEQETLRRANFDALTGLPNRSLFRDRLDYEVVNSRRSGKLLALMFIDLDRFKEVNDLLGHDAGDALLRESAARIRACVRSADTVARLGGDEFTVILTDLDDRAHVESIAEKILAALARPFLLSQEVIHVSGSIGITLHPGDATEPARLLRNADQAMYVAKNAGRNQFSFFTRSMQERAWKRLRLIGELRNALKERQLVLYFQPIIDLKHGHIVKGEALLRWQHPKHGLVCPGEFIGVAEETGLINDIGNWVFMQATDWCKRWSELRGTPFQVSVNKSPVQFAPNDKTIDWCEHVRRIGLARNSIAVEITESLLLNASSSTADKLLNLRDAGVEVAIDDFGTGYSSMAYLKKFDVDYLKVDQSFVRDMERNATSRTIAETIIVMAHKLDLQVIAEGVETPAQRDWLRDAECDYAQGFLFSGPLPPEQFEQLLHGQVAMAG
ncbi:MAG TPA: EAL domain-containing protein [Noviherbaspirillum sp.]|uniref:EAL domain-containing protein n=1 Tax=Noviherbaspirillum sp. TaxID=1926288 RepID=UPI002B478614|nr:EAL domain-containing protein [Noviherbaspirillum sp.]HJV86330.1 EAL domain-containing protein [Noviherbaspirillum sp.]